MTEISADIRYLCETIGVRPPLSQEEYSATQYIKERLLKMGIDVVEQPFFSTGRLAVRMGPVGVLASLGIGLGMSDKRWMQYLGSAIALLAGLSGRRVQSGQPTLWEWPQQRAYNIIGRIPPRATIERQVVLVAHLDTDLERLSGNPTLRNMLPQPCKALQKLAYWGVTLPNGKGWRCLRKLMIGAMAASLALLIADETRAMIPGANNNASGVALLLALAEHLQATPLQHTEVVMAFTSCDTIGGRGSAELASEYGNQWPDARWIVVEGIGAGELCWVTDPKNRLMRPETEVAQQLAQIATANPQWAVMGRPLGSPDRALPLLAHQLNAVALTGYEQTDHYPVQWQRATDTPEIVESDSMNKAQVFLQEVLQALDRND